MLGHAQFLHWICEPRELHTLGRGPALNEFGNGLGNGRRVFKGPTRIKSTLITHPPVNMPIEPQKPITLDYGTAWVRTCLWRNRASPQGLALERQNMSTYQELEPRGQGLDQPAL